MLSGLLATRASLLWVLSAATLVAAAGTAHTRESAPQDWTLDDVKRLIEVTDRTVDLARSLSESTADPANVQRQVLPLLSALESSMVLVSKRERRAQMENQLDGYEYAEVIACVETHTTFSEMLYGEMEEMEEARLAGDEGKLSQLQSSLARFARECTECAMSLTELLDGTKSQAAVDGAGFGLNPLYASVAAFRAVAGLDLKPLLQIQIGANERLVARLEQQCKQIRAPGADTATTNVPHRCVSHVLAVDALPKLKSALSLLSAKGA